MTPYSSPCDMRSFSAVILYHLCVVGASLIMLRDFLFVLLCIVLLHEAILGDRAANPCLHHGCWRENIGDDGAAGRLPRRVKIDVSVRSFDQWLWWGVRRNYAE
ncbi:hypothetical protein BST61_g2053 [Cercospora zeina]